MSTKLAVNLGPDSIHATMPPRKDGAQHSL